MKKIFVAIAVIIAIICFNSCEENYFELPTTNFALNEMGCVGSEIMADSTKSQREWLIEFYNFYNGDEWVNNENWCSPYPLNTWYGIETDSNGYVTAIRLPNNNLISEIDTMFNFKAFPNLHSLDLSNNGLIMDLSHRLPFGIKYLDISKNKVHSIHFDSWSQFKDSLKYLNISDNDTIINLLIANTPNLEELKIDNIKYNNFTLIGAGCPKLKLKHLNISHNNRDGSGMVFISGWDSLQTLDISNVTISHVSIHSTKNLRKIKCNNFKGSMKFYNAWMAILSYGSFTSTYRPYANNIDSIEISNSTLSFSIEKPLNLVYLDAHNTTFTSPCHLEAPLLETVDLCNSNDAEIHIETTQNICRLKNIYCKNAIGHHLVFESYLNRLNINEHFNNIKITCKYSIDTLNISNYNENTLLIHDCNYLDVYNSKIGFNKLNTVNKKANFVNSVCDNLMYNNFANGCYLNFENTILNQINGNADAEPVNANCSFYQSYTEWYNHFPR